ncbi:hypothetical protein [Novosphingobium sp. UBA1939]|uniref:hypothetical protein n=1 Tax=Novosphingobium sp. UBA1939 TaxID=1946982 RepID=UPI0025FEAAAA|nr:hypothetical protein [Novosphingobium sp. UBA1939]
MPEWLSAKAAFGAPRWLLILILVAFVLAMASRCAGSVERFAQGQQEAGAAIQRADDLHETIQRTEKANAARNAIRDPASDARYGQCLRSARTPANCKRFLPDLQPDQP